MADDDDRGDESLPLRLPTSARSTSGPAPLTGDTDDFEADTRRVTTLPKTNSRLKMKLLQEEMGGTDTASGKTGDSILGGDDAGDSQAVNSSGELDGKGDGKSKPVSTNQKKKKSRSKSRSRSPGKVSKSRSLSKSPSKRTEKKRERSKGQDTKEEENGEVPLGDVAPDATELEVDKDAHVAEEDAGSRNRRRSPSKTHKDKGSKSPERKSRKNSPAKKKRSKSPKKSRKKSVDEGEGAEEENMDNGGDAEGQEDENAGEDQMNGGDGDCPEAKGEREGGGEGGDITETRGRKRHKNTKRKTKVGSQSPTKASYSPQKMSASPRKYATSPRKRSVSPQKKTLSPKLRMGPPKPRKPDTPPEPEEYATNVIGASADGEVKILGEVKGENSFEMPENQAPSQGDGAKAEDGELTLVPEGTLEKIEMITQRAQKSKLKKKRRKKKKKAPALEGGDSPSDGDGGEDGGSGGENEKQGDPEEVDLANETSGHDSETVREGEGKGSKDDGDTNEEPERPGAEVHPRESICENKELEDGQDPAKGSVDSQPSGRVGKTRQSSRGKGFVRRSSSYYTRTYMKPKDGSALQLGSIDPATGKRKKVVYIVCNHRIPHRVYTTEDRDRGVPVKCELCKPYMAKEPSLAGESEGHVAGSVNELQEPSAAADSGGNQDGDSGAVKLPPLDIAGAQSLADEGGDATLDGSESERGSTGQQQGGSLMTSRSEAGLSMRFLENGGATPFPARMYFEPRKKLDDYPWLASVAKMPKPPERPPPPTKQPAEIDILRARRFNSLRPKASQNDPVFSRSTRTDRIRKNQKESLLRMQRLKMEALSQVKKINESQENEHNKHAPDWKDDLKEYTKWKDQLAEQIEAMLRKDFPPELDWMVHKKHADAEQNKKPAGGENTTAEDDSGAPYEWKYDIRTKMIDEWQFSRNMTFED